MMIFNRIILLFFVVFIPLSNLFSQNTDSRVRDLQILFDKIGYASTDFKKDSVNDIIIDKVYDFLRYNDISELKDIKNLSVLLFDEKGNTGILTWTVLFSDNKFRFYGFVKHINEDTGRYEIVKLKNNSEEIKNPETAVLTPEDWYGALYYKVIRKKYKREVIYVLLGWDGNDDLTNKKIIDVFYFDENNEPAFGKSIFEYEGGRFYNRLIFEYKEGIGMYLKYDEKNDVIVWDHLSPSKPELKGHYEFYGPDLTYDALYFEKGIWKYIPDYDISKR